MGTLMELLEQQLSGCCLDNHEERVRVCEAIQAHYVSKLVAEMLNPEDVYHKSGLKRAVEIVEGR